MATAGPGTYDPNVQDAQPTLDAGPTRQRLFGVGGATFTSADQHLATAPVTTAPPAGFTTIITDLEVSVDTQMTVTFTEETTGIVVAKYYMPANSVVQVTTRGEKRLSTAGTRLLVQTSVSGNVAVTAGYVYEA